MNNRQYKRWVKRIHAGGYGIMDLYVHVPYRCLDKRSERMRSRLITLYLELYE